MFTQLLVLLFTSLFSHAANGWKGKDRPRVAKTRLYRSSKGGYHTPVERAHPLHVETYLDYKGRVMTDSFTPTRRQVCEDPQHERYCTYCESRGRIIRDNRRAIREEMALAYEPPTYDTSEHATPEEIAQWHKHREHQEFAGLMKHDHSCCASSMCCSACYEANNADYALWDLEDGLGWWDKATPEQIADRKAKREFRRKYDHAYNATLKHLNGTPWARNRYPEIAVAVAPKPQAPGVDDWDRSKFYARMGVTL
ncbi:MAG: hypothetical protein M3141_10655 [Actinomycetota bacterium]|nr:hypothetical protein [Actinomycetota bacterium]